MSGDPYECPRCGCRTVTLACAEGRCARPVVSRRDADGKPVAWMVGLVDLVDLDSSATVEAPGDGAVGPALTVSGSSFDPRRDLPARVQRALWPKCGAVDLAPDGSAAVVVPDAAEAEELAATSDELERHRRDAAFWREQHGRAVAMRDEEIRRYQEGAASLRARLDAAAAERDAARVEGLREGFEIARQHVDVEDGFEFEGEHHDPCANFDYALHGRIGGLECAHCGAPATCRGGSPPAFACDDCCGHGGEDGRCEPIGANVLAEHRAGLPWPTSPGLWWCRGPTGAPYLCSADAEEDGLYLRALWSPTGPRNALDRPHDGWRFYAVPVPALAPTNATNDPNDPTKGPH